MISILRILGFILVQGHVVCDRELYPVSMFRMDVDENQPIDLPENGETKPPRGKSDGERRAVGPPIDVDVQPLKNQIADAYGFQKDPNKDQWKKLPSFEGQIGKGGWAEAAQLAEQFFRNNNNHATPWQNLLATRTPINLLYITAARYLFVTDVLWVQSNRQLIACKEKRDKYSGIIQSFEIPATGVCFPLPYGSATYKSDYDVGLIGVNSGTLTQSFNQYFQAAAPNGFGKPSELVFDTNVYAFTLEFAMPMMFLKLPETFAAKVAKLETKVRYKMQELASAYYKMFKYNNNFFQALTTSAQNNMQAAPRQVLNEWLTAFDNMNNAENFRKGARSDQAFRLAHNNRYQAFVAAVSQNGGYVPNGIDNVVKALLYAAEAYHTRGAIRHVVQGMQMKAIERGEFNTPLLTYDLWVSMIENWGDANKEYAHCGPNVFIAACLNKMSKYLWRMFNAMRLVRVRLPSKSSQGLLAFGTTDDPESATQQWRRKGANADAKSYYLFLKKFECNAMINTQTQRVVANTRLSVNCMTNINNKVNAYNIKLAGLVTNKDGEGM